MPPSARVESVRAYLLDVHAPRHLSGGTWSTRQHAVLAFAGAGHRGWGECLAAVDTPAFELTAWSAPLRMLVGLPIADALATVGTCHAAWPPGMLEAAELALLDLLGRCEACPATTLLALPHRDAVAALPCILERDPAIAAARARDARGTAYLKLKLFGARDDDRALVRAVRAAAGPGIRLLGDVNEGYPHEPGAPLDELAATLRALAGAGLDLCEDPAPLALDEWRMLRPLVHPLDLVPDVPCRPAWTALDALPPDMGALYNLHPDCLGSIAATVALALRVRGFGGQIMVGDDSLVGPGCTAWQQLAVGLGAVCVEALEKPTECDVFLRCVRTQATHRTRDGTVQITAARPGFGLDVDEAMLSATADAVVDW